LPRFLITDLIFSPAITSSRAAAPSLVAISIPDCATFLPKFKISCLFSLIYSFADFWRESAVPLARRLAPSLKPLDWNTRFIPRNNR